jgi:hypothetical protein
MSTFEQAFHIAIRNHTLHTKCYMKLANNRRVW